LQPERVGFRGGFITFSATEIFKRYYAHEFSPEQVEAITGSIRAYHAKLEQAAQAPGGQ
jgi:hypothetical protein